jgi:hypothetical protein
VYSGLTDDGEAGDLEEVPNRNKGKLHPEDDARSWKSPLRKEGRKEGGKDGGNEGRKEDDIREGTKKGRNIRRNQRRTIYFKE